MGSELRWNPYNKVVTVVKTFFRQFHCTPNSYRSVFHRLIFITALVKILIYYDACTVCLLRLTRVALSDNRLVW